jgi:hypothetical protein
VLFGILQVFYFLLLIAKIDEIIKKKMIRILLVFFRYSSNYDVTFKITNKLKVNNDNFKFNSDFKNYITVERILGEY